MNARLPILNLWVDRVDMQSALQTVKNYVCFGERPHSVFASNPEKNFSVPKNQKLWESFKNADLIIPDGIGMVLAARLLYRAKLGRVPGVELMENICALSADEGFRVFLYGAKEEVSAEAEQILLKKYPGLQIVGRQNGYLPKEQMPDLIDRINDSRAQVLFLALGSPRQEDWYNRYAGQLATVRVCQGIGGTLDAITGRVERAPQLWQRMNAEWLFRLLKEPSRIKRQTVLPVFAAQIGGRYLKQVFGFKRNDDEGSSGGRGAAKLYENIADLPTVENLSSD